MALIVTAPDEIYSIENSNNTKIFLAGGITNCPDWQSELIEMIQNHRALANGVTIYNPRRKDFPIEDPSASETQITWEYNHLRDADAVIFWFSRGSLNPIVLYELGMWGNSRNRNFVVGIDSEYERKQDVILQIELAKPTCKLVYSLEAIREWIVYLMLGKF